MNIQLGVLYDLIRQVDDKTNELNAAYAAMGHAKARDDGSEYSARAEVEKLELQLETLRASLIVI